MRAFATRKSRSDDFSVHRGLRLYPALIAGHRLDNLDQTGSRTTDSDLCSLSARYLLCRGGQTTFVLGVENGHWYTRCFFMSSSQRSSRWSAALRQAVVVGLARRHRLPHIYTDAGIASRPYTPTHRSNWIVVFNVPFIIGMLSCGSANRAHLSCS